MKKQDDYFIDRRVGVESTHFYFSIKQSIFTIKLHCCVTQQGGVY